MEWAFDILRELAGAPWAQGLVAALATFVLEDPVTVGSALLVAEGRMDYAAALIGLSAGIAAGDVGLYLLGRFGQGLLIRRAWLDEERLRWAARWFGSNIAFAVVGSRFVPGMRLPTNVAAGVLRVPLRRYLPLAMASSVVWTLVTVHAILLLDAALLERLGALKWPLAAAVVAAVVAMQWRKRRRATPADADVVAAAVPDPEACLREDPVVSLFEFWPMWLFYAPVFAYVCLLSLRHWRHGGMAAIGLANPAIYAGGFYLESKSSILELVGPDQRQWVAPWTTLAKPSPCRHPQALLAKAEERLRTARIDYPLVAKPDVGQRGLGVKLLHKPQDLANYLKAVPEGDRLVLQALAPHDAEAGVLFCRMPGKDQGRILSLTLKRFPEVVGDGRSTLGRLIRTDRRIRCAPGLRRVYAARHAEHLDRVPASGERLRLVFAGNHAQGAIFLDGRRELGLDPDDPDCLSRAMPGLLQRLQDIADSMTDFHFGRFDIRYNSLEALKHGRDLRIVEINGAGAEATHIWDARVKLTEAYRDLFRQFRILFAIGAANHDRGKRGISLWRFTADVARHAMRKRDYPPTD